MSSSTYSDQDTPHSSGPRPVNASADDLVEVTFTVNGTPATLNLPARVTLADALRDHLGLTGTHLGCEHGVCGMCTVLIDGEAARACLLFAIQLDGAAILTVEGLGTPDDLHPLQESFGRNHALQCGFCTPGFLLSSYDLLTNKPEVTDEELPEELSGVLCRCTGYRNIVTAVSETHQAHPEGIPAPGNCGSHALVGRTTGQPSRYGSSRRPSEATAEATATREITLPHGEPTVTVEVSNEIDVSTDAVWRVIDDVYLLARCLPGAELTEDLGANHYVGRAQVSVGPVKLTLTGQAHIIEHDRSRQRMRMLAQGQDRGGAQTLADIVLRTDTTASGTALHAEAHVYLTGRIAQFGRTLAGDVSHRMFEQFAGSLEQAAHSGEAPTPQVGATSALRLLRGSIAARIRAVLHRIRRPRRQRHRRS